MTTLASPIQNLKAHYPIVIVGSGYGGAIMASRLARANQLVCVLERGKEFQVGDYPNTEIEALGNLQVTGLARDLGSPLGLYDIHYSKEISAFVGCGLGGTSLINANVSLRAEKRVFEKDVWPKLLRDDWTDMMEKYYHYAETMLRPTPYPEHFPNLPKLQALEKSAHFLGGKFYRPPIAVSFTGGVNHVGVEQRPCQLCGDCVSGCNYAAKNTLIMNYLPDAKNFGAELFTQIRVEYIEQQNERWIIYYKILGSHQIDAEQLHFLTADLVILAAGALGTTEILLRSKMKGLKVSDQVGKRFTGNGDVLAFAYNNQEVVDGVGYNDHAPEGRSPVGPCITGIIDLREQAVLDKGMVIEEGVIPGAVASFLPKIMALSAKYVGLDNGFNPQQMEREIQSLIHGPFVGAIQNTQTYLVMAHDNDAGQMFLENNQLRIHWPEAGKQAIFATINDQLQKATEPLGGVFIPNPIWSEAMGKTLITVHPLGGCVLADDAAVGVVNHKGQVFKNVTGAEVYFNLYIADGSIVPCSLGVNPLLTISALAERTASLLAEDKGWQINYALPSKPREIVDLKKIGLVFTETMRGRYSGTILNNYTLAYTNATSLPCEFTLTIAIDDLDKMLTDDRYEANIHGTVTIIGLSQQPLVVSQGTFCLFTKDIDAVATRKMLYTLSLESIEGKRYVLKGFKTIRQDEGLDLWDDTTTLYIDILDETQTICGKGILKILPEDFIEQLASFKVLNSSNPSEILKAKARFGRHFAGVLFEIYGGIFARPSLFNPAAQPRNKRILRVNAPLVFHFKTEDNKLLRLTRYQGGVKGPVLLSHGLGVSSAIFLTDTIETNLVEFLFAEGYDVWLLDYRASINLPTSNELFSADEIALYDYPAAVSKILEITEAHDLQVVAHCFGAVTLCMSMLAGLKGVRSIVFSQVAANIKTKEASEIKAGLYIPTLMDNLGIKSLSAYTDTQRSWQDQLVDLTLELSSQTACNNPICARITFLYGPLYQHQQLNQMTHDSLHEMFGVSNIKAFEHLALMIRKGFIVNALGENVYLPHLERLALPVLFIHGASNECFIPKSTELTLKMLQEKNGDAFYKRYVIPNYGHIDCIFGKNAAKEVYSYILEHLESTLVISAYQH